MHVESRSVYFLVQRLQVYVTKGRREMDERLQRANRRYPLLQQTLDSVNCGLPVVAVRL